MKILSFSSSFPSSVRPTEGIFVLHRLRAIAQKVPLEVVHPLATIPLIGSIHSRAALPLEERVGDLTVYHRRFSYVPGILKRFDSRFYALGLENWLRMYCARERPTLLDAHFAWPDGVGVSYLARGLGLPYTITLRGTINPRYPIRCFRRRMADALQHAAAVISVNRSMADIAIQLGAAADRVHVIANGVDMDRFKPVPKAEARRALDIPQDQPLVVSVASLKPPKGHEDLIRAMATEKMPLRARLIIIGGETDFGAYRRLLQRLVESLGLRDRVVFAGVLPQETVAAYFSAADVSVLASYTEGCPNAVLESLACGTPVIGTPVGAIPEWLKDGENGYVVPVGDPSAIGGAIAKALRRPWSRDTVRRGIIGRTWETVAKETLSVFEEALRVP